jgi:hypothetical protein
MTKGWSLNHTFFWPFQTGFVPCGKKLQALQLRKELRIMPIGALRGAARRAFTAKHGKDDLNHWSFRPFELAMARMVPDFQAHFTDATIQMSFRADMLVDDVTRFVLIQYGGIDANCH